MYEWFDSKPRNILLERLAIWTAIFAVYASPFIFAISCLIGSFYPGPVPAIGLLVSILLWLLRWAVRPWVVRPDSSTVRTLRPNQYVLISALAKSEWIDDMVEWARVSPDFDTRHLNACTALWQDDPLNVRKFNSGVSMKNALDFLMVRWAGVSKPLMMPGRLIKTPRQSAHINMQSPGFEYRPLFGV